MMNQTVSLAITILAAVLIAELVLFLLRRLKFKNRRAGTVLSLIRSLIRYIAGIVIVWAVLDYFGFDPKTIVAGIGILTLIIGFSAESLISDVVTGVFMVFENQYNVGDVLEVQGFRGTVTEMGIRTTSLMDTGGNIKIINNSDMSNILNRSDFTSTAVCDLTVAADAAFPELEAKIPTILADIYEKNPGKFQNPPEYLGVEAIKGSNAVLRFVARVPEVSIYEAQRLLNHELMVRFLAAGIRLS